MKYGTIHGRIHEASGALVRVSGKRMPDGSYKVSRTQYDKDGYLVPQAGFDYPGAWSYYEVLDAIADAGGIIDYK
jgi:hypothetical protein